MENFAIEYRHHACRGDELERGLIQTAGLPAGAGVFLGALARIARAIFTFTIRITALGWFFAHAMYSIRLLPRLLKDFHFSSFPCLLRI